MLKSLVQLFILCTEKRLNSVLSIIQGCHYKIKIMTTDKEMTKN